MLFTITPRELNGQVIDRVSARMAPSFGYELNGILAGGDSPSGCATVVGTVAKLPFEEIPTVVGVTSREEDRLAVQALLDRLGFGPVALLS